jgi:hypothetical protein
MSHTYTELERRKILSILGHDRELIQICFAGLYTTNKEAEKWLFSDLEGLLCFVLDYQLRTRYFIMFDSNSFEKLFSFELYNNFSTYYHTPLEDFHCFEAGNGFIGFKFNDQKEASTFSLVVKKFEDNFVKMLFENQSLNRNTKKEDKKKFHEDCALIKEKFQAKNSFDENYIEDGLEICKPKYFDLLNNITFDREKKEFKMGHIPPEFKKLFKNIGIKKSDFKNTQLALNIFKHFIEGMDNYEHIRRETVVRKKGTIHNKNYKHEKNENKNLLDVITEESIYL